MWVWQPVAKTWTGPCSPALIHDWNINKSQWLLFRENMFLNKASPRDMRWREGGRDSARRESSIKKGGIKSLCCTADRLTLDFGFLLRTQKVSDLGLFGVMCLLIASCKCLCSRHNEISHSRSLSLSFSAPPAFGRLDSSKRHNSSWTWQITEAYLLGEEIGCAYVSEAGKSWFSKEKNKSGRGGGIRMVCFECDARPGDPLDSGARWLISLLRGSEVWFGATAEDAEIEWRWEG